MPYVLAFKDEEEGSPIYYFELCMDFLFLIDIFVTFNSSYIDSKGVHITRRFAIAKSYVFGTFFIDVLAIFPFYLFTSASGKSNSLIRILRISKLTRIFRGSKILTVFKNFARTEAADKLIKIIQTYSGVARLLSAIYIILLLAHFIACLWYFVAKIDDFGPDTWVFKRGLLDADEIRLYLSSLYFSFAILTTVGFGDIHANTVSEIVLCIMWMVFGIGFYSFIIGTLTSVLSSFDSSNTARK